MRRWLSFCLLRLFPLFGASAWAQAAATADLHVVVKDPGAAIVKNATVTVRETLRNIERTTRTDINGDYAFLALPPGAYRVTVEARGFATVVMHNVILTVGQIAELPMVLQLAMIAETVSVT